jgi:hypothetical protein
MISPKIDPIRLQIATALYPRYLDYMDIEFDKPDDGMPPYNLETAAEDAVLAADYLVKALSTEPGAGKVIESLTDAIEARR